MKGGVYRMLTLVSRHKNTNMLNIVVRFSMDYHYVWSKYR